MTKRLLATVLLFTAASAATAWAKGEDPIELDELSLGNIAAWSCARTIAIGSVKIPKDFKGAKPAEEYIAFYQDLLATGFRAMPGVAEVTILKAGEASASDLVVETEFTELTNGSRGARFWIGFGAGKSKAGLRMVARLRSGEEAFVLEHARLSAMGLKKDELTENITETVDDVVKVLAKRRSACPDPAMFPAPAPKAEPTATGAKVALESQPKDAEVYVDGKLVGNAPVASYQLPAGRHLLEFRMKGMATWSREIEVTDGQETRFVATLEPEGTPAPPALTDTAPVTPPSSPQPPQAPSASNPAPAPAQEAPAPAPPK